VIGEGARLARQPRLFLGCGAMFQKGVNIYILHRISGEEIVMKFPSATEILDVITIVMEVVPTCSSQILAG
jgi:hypothetical protein